MAILLITGLMSPKAQSASCCGGGFAVPSLITGDDKAQLTSSLTYSRVADDVFEDGTWQKRTAKDESQIFKIETAHIFADQYQAGFSLPVSQRIRSGDQGGSTTGLGDIMGILGYEYLPDWDYNPWRPHGVGFLSLTLPTGKSIYDDSTMAGLDSLGRGFWALGAGTVLTKAWQSWDFNSSFEIHRAFKKDVHNSQYQGTATPGTGGSVSIGTGYNILDWRLGASLAWSYEDPIHFDGILASSQGNIQRYTSGSLMGSYAWKTDWTGTLSYVDQTLFGNPTNTTLSKSVTFLLQKRWSR